MIFLAELAFKSDRLLDHFFIFQKNSLHLKMANFSSLKSCYGKKEDVAIMK